MTRKKKEEPAEETEDISFVLLYELSIVFVEIDEEKIEE